MTIIFCCAIVCATALAALQMYLKAQRPQVTRADLEQVLADVKLFRGELITIEKKLVEWGRQLLSVEKIAKLHAGPQPILPRQDPAGGPRTRAERQGNAEEKKD